MDFDDHMQRIRRAKQAFSPTAPVGKRDLFAGRVEQIMSLVDAVDEPGQHLVVYGERGVGKTSLAAVSTEILSRDYIALRINCTAEDTYSSVWRRAFNEISLTNAVQSAGFAAEAHHATISAIDALGLPELLTSDHVRVALRALSAQRNVVVFFDEFDRMADQETHSQFADTIKTLSDQGVGATIVVVGVADDVAELIREHASVERALAQINMPRMSEGELAEIVTKGLDSIEMTIDPRALRAITRLSQGLPHYTHLLAQEAAVNAVSAQRVHVTTDDVRVAVGQGLNRTQESVANLYYAATYSSRENLYKQVLLACALANADERGFFSATNVRESLSEILGRKMEIPQFAGHLNAFSSDRGPVLKKEGVQRKFRYRFTNPLMQPYVLMRGVKEGLIPAKALDLG